MISPFLAEILSGWNAYDVRAKFNRDRTSADRDVPLGLHLRKSSKSSRKNFAVFRVGNRTDNYQVPIINIAIMGQAERPTCPGCGAHLILALPPGGDGRRTFQCFECDRPDPLKTDQVTGWLKGELQPPK